MGSPPKPWERATAAASTPSLASTPAPAPAAPTATASGAQPSIPERPAAFGAASTTANTLANRYGGYGGAGTYGGVGGIGGYSGYGGMGSTYGGYGMGGMGSYGGGYGMGGMGGMGGYGGYGSGMGMYGAPGMGMYGGPGMGMYGGPGQQPTLAQQLESTTSHTFNLLHSVVQTFGGVAQMLESTFMATHSSFFAMVSVVDQFHQLREVLGGVLGMFGLLRWLRSFLPGYTPPPQGPLAQQQPKLARKPLIMFLLAMVGIPYLLSRLVRNHLANLQQQQQLPPLDPSQLTFARALYPFQASTPAELNLTENEIVAITSKLVNGQEVDPRVEMPGVPEPDWWKGRTRDGREGWFPRKWVEVLVKKDKALADTSSPTQPQHVPAST
ncbi:hypothetical protein CYLTODRAFT_39559 [Cylindrobasidium torrendii FP15055 ss-10]|uniref:Peroxisomal membrane protein PEX13 n=1 Tax=Cylindrobasidium torrendii FP15055 ss-10 TaxID=1314674 RepID=A0A0D7B7M9_9AGAR|nr:hypothetical protein CYLTODRAFT_39559 [Cylindrobasidium torrendii FP15055 ss-10]